MFDDYDYKDTGVRISVRFSQVVDEPMYPWEIASFLKKFNTVYYKFELLNSISSAISCGISPEDIFVFDHSLPLYERYAELNLLSGAVAAKLFYPIGLPVPLVPSVDVYEHNLLYRLFHSVNSFLTKNHIGPLSLEHVAFLYDGLRELGLAKVEETLFEYAYKQADKSYEAAAKRGEKKKQFTEEDFNKHLRKYYVHKNQLFSDIEKLKELGDEDLLDILTLEGRDNQRLTRLLTAFLTTFEKTARPLVCARVSDNKFRVLGRSLVNKQEQVGLEVKEVTRNSPLGALFEGGAAIYQAIQQEKRAKELHEIDLQIKVKELELADAKLQGQRIKNLDHSLKLSESLKEVAANTDISTVYELPPSFLKNQLIVAYSKQHANAVDVMHNQGLRIEHESIRLIDFDA